MVAHDMQSRGSVTKKADILRHLQAVRDLAEIANRHSTPLSGTLYLMRLRKQPLRIAIPKVQRRIDVVAAEADVSELVKIVIRADSI